MVFSEWRLLALYRHKEILVNSSLKTTRKKMARAISKNQVSDPGPSCFCLLQIEVHLHLANCKLIDYCKENNVIITAYSPLGAPGLKRYEQAFAYLEVSKDLTLYLICQF